MSDEKVEKKGAALKVTAEDLQVLSEQLKNSLAEVQALKSDLLTQANQSAARMAGGSPIHVSDEQIDEFFSRKRGKYEIWTNNPNFAFLLTGGGREWDDKLRREVQTPVLVLKFTRHWGPGAELLGPDDKKLYANGIGFADLEALFRAEKWPEADLPIMWERVVEAAKRSTPDCKVYVGDEFLLELQAAYAERQAIRNVREEYATKKAEMEVGLIEGDPKA